MIEGVRCSCSSTGTGTADKSSIRWLNCRGLICAQINGEGVRQGKEKTYTPSCQLMSLFVGDLLAGASRCKESLEASLLRHAASGCDATNTTSR
jgi:hypothetical protein